MVSISKIEQGAKRYVDHHFIPNLPDGGFQKVVVATGAALLVNRVGEILKEWAHNDTLRTLGIVDHAGAFDLEAVKNELMKHVDDAGMHLEMPLIGTLTFKREDIERLYRCIMEV
jgi:hypothetical protein